MKKYSWKVVVLIILAIGILGYGYFRRAQKKSETPIQEESKKENLKMISTKTETEYTVATVTYPEFTHTTGDFNKKIADTVKNKIIEQSKNAEESWQARYDTRISNEKISKVPDKEDRFSLDIGTTIIRNDQKVISFKIDVYEFSGGAHGNTSVYTFNYDVVKQKEITFDTIKNGDANFLQKLSERSRILLRADLARRGEITPDEVNIEMLNDGTAPTKDNFSLFTIPEEGKITFHFIAYQVAPYVFGPSEITLDLPIKLK